MGKKKDQRSGGGNRKKGRNFRWDGVPHTLTKYRARHGIDANISRKDAKAKKRERDSR